MMPGHQQLPPKNKSLLLYPSLCQTPIFNPSVPCTLLVQLKLRCPVGANAGPQWHGPWHYCATCGSQKKTPSLDRRKMTPKLLFIIPAPLDSYPTPSESLLRTPPAKYKKPNSLPWHLRSSLIWAKPPTESCYPKHSPPPKSGHGMLPCPYITSRSCASPQPPQSHKSQLKLSLILPVLLQTHRCCLHCLHWMTPTPGGLSSQRAKLSDAE